MSSEAVNMIDVTALRQALRLVHCLQKERGASCSYHASKSQFHKRLSVEPARRDTDRALRKASMCMNSHNARVVLEKIRKTTESQGVSYHRILVTYNCLISAIVHDGIWKYTNQKNREQDELNVKHDSNPNRKRVPSHHDIMELQTPAEKNKPQHRRLQSEDNFRGRLSMDSIDFNFVHKDMGLNHGLQLPENKMKPLARIDSIGSEPANEPSSDNKPDEANPQISLDLGESDYSIEPANLSRLLTLLGTFVELTESIGVERATLCSILAVGRESHHLLAVCLS